MPDQSEHARGPLTAARRGVLEALKLHLDEHGDMPTAEQLAAAANVSSADAVREHLGWLVVNGYLTDDPAQPGGIRFTADPPERGAGS